MTKGKQLLDDGTISFRCRMAFPLVIDSNVGLTLRMRQGVWKRLFFG